VRKYYFCRDFLKELFKLRGSEDIGSFLRSDVRRIISSELKISWIENSLNWLASYYV